MLFPLFFILFILLSLFCNSFLFSSFTYFIRTLSLYYILCCLSRIYSSVPFIQRFICQDYYSVRFYVRQVLLKYVLLLFSFPIQRINLVIDSYLLLFDFYIKFLYAHSGFIFSCHYDFLPLTLTLRTFGFSSLLICSVFLLI